MTVATTAEPLTISVEEAGRLLGVSRNVAYEAARRGEIPTLKIGRKRLVVPRARLMAMLNGSTPERTAA